MLTVLLNCRQGVFARDWAQMVRRLPDHPRGARPQEQQSMATARQALERGPSPSPAHSNTWDDYSRMEIVRRDSRPIQTARQFISEQQVMHPGLATGAPTRVRALALQVVPIHPARELAPNVATLAT